MKHYRRFLLLLAMLSAATFAIAQNITGHIIDEQSQPMPFANVVLVNRVDSTFITGAVTKDDGTFDISTDKQDGLLKVSNVGYILMYIDARQGNVGDIQMQPDTQTLGEVVVKGERPQYKMTTGGMTVDIQNSLLKDVGNADRVVPYTYGERFHQIWPGSEYYMQEYFDHGFSQNIYRSTDLVAQFLIKTLK